MRQFNVKAWLVALSIALVPCIASAVGLGRLTMLSTLGDRLNLEIDLVSVSKEELSTLSARVSSAEAYKQANLQYNAALVGARVSIERRQSGQPYVKITSARPVNEPFIDVLVEVTSSSGRLVREYTVLVDPPGTAPAQAAAPAAAPPAAAPIAPPAAAPAPRGRRPEAAAPAAAPMAGAKEYGPIKQGENLSSIARNVRPEGVTLEQMMVGLYRSNPDAFINKNLNLVRAGRILRVPEKDDVAAIAPAEARKEFRAQVADWNSYRQNVAGAPGTARAEGRSTATGRITPRVEDKAGAEPKDVVRLSRGEPAGAGKGKGTTEQRVRALEEEVLARDKALAEANERISQLEKTIKDMQKLAELKSPGMAAAQQKAEQAAKAKPEVQPAPKPEAKAEIKDAPKPEPAPAPKAEAPAIVAVKPEADKAPAKPEPEKAPAVAEAEKAPPPDAAKAEAKAEAPKAEKAAVAEEPTAKPKPKVIAPPPAPPSTMDQIMEAATDPLYLGAGAGLLALGGLAFWMARRRRGAGEADDDLEPRKATPVLGRTAGAAADPDTTMTMPASAIAAATAVPAAAAAVDEVDPLAEAEVYIAYGRDAQAEEILKDALAKNPQREDAQLKLLEIFSARKDTDSFDKVAAGLNHQTGGSGGTWLAAAAMGYALDPNNPLYEAGRHAAPAVAAAAGTASDLDFELGGDAAGVATDITLDSGAVANATAAHHTTAVLDAGELRSMAAAAQAESPAPLMPDFSLDIPAAGDKDAAVTQTDFSLDAPVPTQDGHVIDFQIELPKVDAPETIAPATETPTTDAGLDFKLDIPDLDLGEKTTVDGGGGGGEKDGHWYDVQTKFDLAKAYQEMGDKDGAKEILQEVIKEGDSDQQSQAKKLLESLA